MGAPTLGCGLCEGRGGKAREVIVEMWDNLSYYKLSIEEY
jgi:hypothetical protein